jgi:hypothetical protein
MRKSFAILAVIGLLAVTASAQAVTPRGDLFLKAIQVTPGQISDGVPDYRGSAAKAGGPDTVYYGGLAGGYAIEGGTWDFGTLASPSMQGWYGVDLKANDPGDPWFVHVTSADFPGCTAPIITGGIGQLWIGKKQATADLECWACDAGLDCSLGYRGDMCQQVDSPELDWAGGDVALTFKYFSDCEGTPFDFTKVQVVLLQGGIESEAVTMEELGGVIGRPDSSASFSQTLLDFQIDDDTDGIKIRFEFVADGGWSDADGLYCSTYGPFAADDVVVNIGGGAAEGTYNFNAGIDGWDPGVCIGPGNFVHAGKLDGIDYAVLDPCSWSLEGGILVFDDPSGLHPGDPNGQLNMAVSPPIDRSAWAPPDYNSVMVEADVYALMPLNNGVLYRPGAFYYPWECAETGSSGWSPRSGQDVWNYVGDTALCFKTRYNLTTDGVSGIADLYRVTWELISCCSCFSSIGPNCTGVTNDTPYLDNIRFIVTGVADAPVVDFPGGLGVRYQDGFGQGGFLEVDDTGNSDNWENQSPTFDQPPFVLGDSVAIGGPVVGAPPAGVPSYNCYLWFNVERVGPGTDAGAYAAWDARIPGDPTAGFVKVRMDSSETIAAFKNKYATYFHESEPGFDAGAGDISDGNEILPDGLFSPGTKIHYFFTSNYVGNPEQYVFPDTTGQFYYEFEVLPSMRDVGGGDVGFPCVLYVDAFNVGAENILAPALDAYLPDVPGAGPDYDKYDELGASSNYNASGFYRSLGGNNGATLPQLLGYRAIIVNTGSYSAGAMEELDLIGLEDWLNTTICDVSDDVQGLIFDGDQAAAIVEFWRPSFLSGSLGAGLTCSPYRLPGCPDGTDPDTSYCVAVLDAAAGAAGYPPAGDYYAFGNGCPNIFEYSVLFADGGTGNRDWWDYDGTKGVVSHSAVTNTNAGLGNFKTVVTGYSSHNTTTTFAGGTCVPDEAGRVAAAGTEIIGALTWVFGGSPPSLCTDPCFAADTPDLGGVDARVNRLFQNEPNPFNPRTVLRFSVSSRGPVELAIYDVSGRLVKTLVNGPVDAGSHNVVWDGTDNEGRKVTSGIYWSQYQAGDYISSKKMVLLK